MAAAIETISEQRCHGGVQGFYAHQAMSTGTRMQFSVFVPNRFGGEPIPALYYLAGLTCNEETFMIKAGAQALAAEQGVVLVACDTSPRGLGYAGEDDDWDFGTGAGFYLNATEQPWSQGYQMGEYIDNELPSLIEAHFTVASDRRGICGHSMGGHGALVTALRNPEYWHSVSAFAPICNPAAVPWGQKAFKHYLGADESDWLDWDASFLMRDKSRMGEILVDQGLDDQFLEHELHPDALEAAAVESGQRLTLRRHRGYDHSYWFIQSFIDEHIAFHAKQLA